MVISLSGKTVFVWNGVHIYIRSYCTICINKERASVFYNPLGFTYAHQYLSSHGYTVGCDRRLNNTAIQSIDPQIWRGPYLSESLSLFRAEYALYQHMSKWCNLSDEQDPDIWGGTRFDKCQIINKKIMNQLSYHEPELFDTTSITPYPTDRVCRTGAFIAATKLKSCYWLTSAVYESLNEL